MIMESKLFDNKERDRYYGLRVGDIVTLKFSNKNPEPIAEVIGYGIMDNNRVYVRMLEDSKETDWVAECCDIVTKVENRDWIKDLGV